MCQNPGSARWDWFVTVPASGGGRVPVSLPGSRQKAKEDLPDGIPHRKAGLALKGNNNAMGHTAKNTHLLRKPAFLIGLCGGIGGVSIDLDHILNMATGGVVSWTMFHSPVVVVVVAVFCAGCFIALIGGLLGSLVLDFRRRRRQTTASV